MQIRLQNLDLLIEKYGSQDELASRIGCTAGYVNQIKKGRRPLSEKAARKFEAKLSLPNMFFDTDECLAKLSGSPSTTTSSLEQNVTPYESRHKDVPLISFVQAGDFCEAIDNFQMGDAELWLPCPVAHSDNTFALHVAGDSMTSPYPNTRSYPAGTLIYIDPYAPLSSGKCVVAKQESENTVTFKKYIEDAGKKWLMPINPVYEKIELSEGMHICGVLIFSGNFE